MPPGRYDLWPTDELEKTLVNLEMYVPFADLELQRLFEEINERRILYEKILRQRERAFVDIPRIKAVLKGR
jgi:hypothetical protein